MGNARAVAAASLALLLVAAASGILRPSIASAVPSTLFVNRGASNCSDAGAGSSTQPFCTIVKAGSTAVAGQTVIVSSGTYGGSVSVANSGTATAPIVFRNATGATVTISGGTNGFKVSGRSWVTIRGFQVTSTSGAGIYLTGATRVVIDSNTISTAGRRVSGQTAAGIKLSGTTNSQVVSNVSRDNSDHGIFLTGASTGNVVRSNVTRDNARGYVRAAEGIFLSGSSGNTVQGNVSLGNEDSGIGLWDGANNSLIVNNIVYRNGDHGIDVLRSTGEDIVSNTVYGNVDSGIELQGGSGADLSNNISADNGINSPRTSGNIRVVDSASASQSTFDYDLVFLSSDNDLIDWLGTAYSSLSAFQAATGREPQGRQRDPRWVNPASGDFHVLAGSPAIDSANSGAFGQQAADAQGSPRVDDPLTANAGAGPRAFDDRGAYEFQPAPGGNRPPVANPDSASTVQDTPVTINVLANDTDPDGDSLTVTGIWPPGHGTAVRNGDNTITYTPATGYVGGDALGYSLSDGRGGTASGVANLTVKAANRPPVANTDFASTRPSVPVTINVLANDTDPDGDSLTVTGIWPPGHGTAVRNGDNTITYTPATGYVGGDALGYSLSDGRGGTASGVVNLTVSLTNSPPVANRDGATTRPDTSVTVAVLANDTDPDGDALSVTGTRNPRTAPRR